MSHPARGGWIEIPWRLLREHLHTMSHPARGGWIEIILGLICGVLVESHPARGGWIEIIMSEHTLNQSWVPPRTGWVD